MARLEFGLSEFLFGSCSALCGIKHGIPGLGPPKRIQAKELRCVCPKQNSAQEKSRGRLCPATLSRDNPAQPRLAGFSLSGAMSYSGGRVDAFC
jgi:hypothetical protein